MEGQTEEKFVLRLPEKWRASLIRQGVVAMKQTKIDEKGRKLPKEMVYTRGNLAFTPVEFV